MRLAIRPQAQPLPILSRLTEHTDEEGPYVLRHNVWNNEDGRRCRWCPAGQCTFEAGSEGLGTCFIRRPGDLAGPPAPTLAWG